MCSDVHLGMNSTDEDGFNALLDRCGGDDKLVLLGDILDFWFDLSNEQERLNYIISYWEKLFKKLGALKKERPDIEIHYIPGNHDSFVFLLETGQAFPWATTVLKRYPALDRVREATRKYPLATVANIHYSFFKLNMENTRVLLTHGHADHWLWQLISGYPEPRPYLWAFLTSLTTAYAHKYAYALRRVAKIGENGFVLGWRVQDIGFKITNSLLNAYYQAGLRIEDDPDHFADRLEVAFRIYCQIAGEVTWADEIHLYHGLQEIDQFMQDASLVETRDKTRAYLKRDCGSCNYTVRYNEPGELVQIEHEDFSNFEQFDKFVCGHFHKARGEEKDDCYDAGCFLYWGSTSTFLQINPDGNIFFPIS